MSKSRRSKDNKSIKGSGWGVDTTNMKPRSIEATVLRGMKQHSRIKH